MASWDPFGGGVKGLTLDSSSWQFPSPRCSHLPSALPRPLGGPRRKSKPPANKEPLPRLCWGWALAQRASTADVHGISRPLGAPAPSSQYRPLSSPRVPTAAAPALVRTTSPWSRGIEPAQGPLDPEQPRCSLKCAVLFSPSVFPDSFKDSLEAARGTQYLRPIN